jgi:hypothetical protein
MATKKCRSCQIRPVAGGTVRGDGDADRATAKSVELCLPCLAEAGWENEHSDYGHADGKNADGDPTDSCWMCHPELNEASADYAARRGTSRAGMTIHVPIRATGKDKAAAVITQLPKGFATSVNTRKGVVTLKAAKGKDLGTVLRWNANGPFISGEANGRKIRNVAEALRVLAA